MKRQINRPNRNTHTRSMTRFAAGMRIRATANFERHSYQAEKTYTVVEVDDSDNTLRARDGSGNEGAWIRWADCLLADEIGWDWLKKVLPAEALDLMTNFDGLEGLRLREDIRTHLILKMPDLKDRILGVRDELEAAGVTNDIEDTADDDEVDLLTAFK